MNAAEIVSKVYLFQTLSESEQAEIARRARVNIFPKGAVVCREGDAGKTFYLVGSGRFSVRRGNPPVDLAVLTTGQYFGEMGLLTGEARTATVEALEPAKLLEIDRPTLMQVISRNPALVTSMSKLVASRRRVLDEVQKTEEERRLRHEAEVKSLSSRIRSVFGLGS
jgi:voltage-gated potassium channel